MKFILISGLSGAGKSKAASFLEDMGYYVVDNMPAALIPKFAELCMASPGRYDKVVLVTDIRGGQTFDGLFDALDKLHDMGCDYKILFVEASVEAIIKRYKETRRRHPLRGETDSLEEAVRREREMMAPVKERADFVIDTSRLSTAQLRGELLRLFGQGEERGAMTVNVTSFGFKYGLPLEADLVLDVRCLPNPFYVPGLKHKTGLDQEVVDFVMGHPEAQELLRRYENFLQYALPLYVKEGKSQLTIAVGCTGGKHRSITFARKIAEYCTQLGYEPGVQHRDAKR